MAIPKEPRQLMINLMYIVLTAILALNVSAEILDAFLSMDQSISESSQIIHRSNDRLMSAIEDQAEAYSQYEHLREKGTAVRQISHAFTTYISTLKEELVDISGGLDEEGRPKGRKDKDVTTRLMIDEGKGALLEQEILRTRAALLEQIDAEEVREQLAQNMPLKINPVPADSDKTSWAQHTFQQMPVAAVLPLLAKLQNDVKVSETSILNHFFNQTSTDIFKPDAFIPVVAAKAGYVSLGEEYEAELFLSAYSSTADNLGISVDGRTVPVRNGKAIFRHRPNSIGGKEHQMDIRLTDPITGAIQQFRKTFRYEVGERSVTVSADKMNVFYVDVDNPLSVSAAGVPSGEVVVEADGASLRKISNGHYIVKPQQIGEATIRVSGGGLDPYSMTYRVKRIPDPIILLGNKRSGGMRAAEFKVHPGIRPHLEHFDFDAKCRIEGFELARVRRGDDVRVESNVGGAYQGRAKSLIEQARVGDTYYFDKIKVKCPGDRVGRLLGGMIFNIR
ncbi:MAG: gliding motility protein GldM [Bacteroidota bacterium]